MTRRFAVLGDPVAHSLSPAMHTAAFAALDLDATYGAERIPGDRPEALEAAMRRLASSGGGNVTLPHKGAAARALDEASDAVRRTGACNCFWGGADGALAGDNTDVAGIAGALASLLGDRAPRSVLVLGAGGAAAGAIAAAQDLGAERIRVANRTPRRAVRLAERFDRLRPGVVAAAWPATGTSDVVVNATSLGLAPGDPAPASFDRLTARVALDLVYVATGSTAWVEAARDRGILAADGRDVLARQGAACYRPWFGVDGPLDVLRSALP